MAPGHLRLLSLLLLFAPPAFSSQSFSPDDQAIELNLYHRYIPPVLAPSTPLPKFRKRGFVNVNLAENSAVLVEEGEGGAIELGLKSDGEYRYQIAVPKTLKGAKSVIGGGGDDDESVWSIVEHTVVSIRNRVRGAPSFEPEVYVSCIHQRYSAYPQR